MVASETAKEAVYLRTLLLELGLAADAPLQLSVDNRSAIDLSYNPEHHQRTKHIHRRHFFVREMVENGVLHVRYVPSEENLADFFTKPLDSTSFFKLRDRIMNVPPASLSAKGG